ncbi:MAG: hypothetical protein ACLRWM_12100 [Streptococcus sp.]
MGFLNQNGQKVVGLQHINGKLTTLKATVSKLKETSDIRGKKYYFDASGEAVTNRFIQVSRGVWYYFNVSDKP